MLLLGKLDPAYGSRPSTCARTRLSRKSERYLGQVQIRGSRVPFEGIPPVGPAILLPPRQVRAFTLAAADSQAAGCHRGCRPRTTRHWATPLVPQGIRDVSSSRPLENLHTSSPVELSMLRTAGCYPFRLLLRNRLAAFHEMGNLLRISFRRQASLPLCLERILRLLPVVGKGLELLLYLFVC